MTVIALPPHDQGRTRHPSGATRAGTLPILSVLHATRHNDLDRLRERNELLASVNHELRTPLTSVVGYSELLLSGDAGELNDEQRSMMERVAVNSTRLLQLIEELVRTTSECLKTNEAVDLGEVMLQVVSTPRVAGSGVPGHPDGPATA
jgi:signal transduction histidine kinase